jgi:hypothetical protein
VALEHNLTRSGHKIADFRETADANAGLQTKNALTGVFFIERI